MPTAASAPIPRDLLEDGDDDTTTVEAGPPAATERTDDELSERTLRPLLGPAALSASPATAPSTLPSPGPASRRPPPVPSASRPPPTTEVSAEDLEEEDEEPESKDDSITTLAPRLSPSTAGIALPASVEIRTVEYDDDADADETETEVRTTPGVSISQIPPTLKPVSSAESTSPRPAAGVPASEASRSTLPDLEDTRLDDSEDGATTARPIVPVAPIESPEDEDDITTKGAIPASTYEEDSVTTRAPPVTTAQMKAAIADLERSRHHDPPTLEGSTKGIPKRAPAAGRPPPASPADAEPESITTQAPAPLTNMLRVNAADATPDDGAERAREEEEHESNTEVMPNAPLKRVADDAMAETMQGLPAIRPTRPLALPPNAGPTNHAARAAAPQLAPGSESGLRSSRPSSGVALAAPHDPRAFAATEGFQATAPLAPLFTPPPMNIATLPPGTPVLTPSPSMQPSAQDVPAPKGPRYGLLVGIVALVSVVVPGSLYFGLQDRDGASNNGTPAEAQTELESHDGTPRAKLDKKAAAAAAAVAAAAASASAAAASASASASPSASSSHGRPVAGGRRH